MYEFLLKKGKLGNREKKASFGRQANYLHHSEVQYELASDGQREKAAGQEEKSKPERSI